MKTKKALSASFIFLVLAFVYLPIMILVLFSFNSANSFATFSGFSFRWYKELFSNRAMLEAMQATIIVAVISTVVSTIIGTLAAIGLSKQKRILRNVVLGINQIPIVSPEIVTAISFFVLFGAFMIPSGYLTVTLAHIAFSTPYVIITVYPKVRTLDPNLADAASDLGATPFKTLYKVILPQIKVSIAAGAAIAFTMSFDDFVISYFAAGSSSFKNISIYLYTLKRGINPSINALTTIILLVIGIKVIYDIFFKARRLERKEKLRG